MQIDAIMVVVVVAGSYSSLFMCRSLWLDCHYFIHYIDIWSPVYSFPFWHHPILRFVCLFYSVGLHRLLFVQRPIEIIFRSLAMLNGYICIEFHCVCISIINKLLKNLLFAWFDSVYVSASVSASMHVYITYAVFYMV